MQVLRCASDAHDDWYLTDEAFQALLVICEALDIVEDTCPDDADAGEPKRF
jgi:hypothetical protein